MAVCCEPAVAVMFPDVFLSGAAQSHRFATSMCNIAAWQDISCTGLHVKTSQVPALRKTIHKTIDQARIASSTSSSADRFHGSSAS